MSDIYIDTDKINEISRDIILLGNNYNILIEKLFKRLNQVPRVTREWVGNNSEKYFNTIMFQKSDYIQFGNNIKNFGVNIRDLGSNCRLYLGKVKSEERKNYD